MADNGEVIDKLSIEIDSDIANASKGIDKLQSTLNKLKGIYDNLGGASNSVSEKLKDLASGMAAISKINSESVNGVTDAMKKFSKIDFGRLASIPTGVAENLSSLASSVNLFSMAIDGDSITESLKPLKKLAAFDFGALSDNISRLDPSAASKVREFMSAFEGISGDFALTDSLESMRALFSMDFSGFNAFMASAADGLPGLASGIQTFADACGTPEFEAAIDRLSRLANVDLSGLSQLATNGIIQVVPDVSAQVEREETETRTAWQSFKSFMAKEMAVPPALSNGFSALGSLGRGALPLLRKGFNGIRSAADKATARIQKFTRSIGRIALYRSIRFLFSQIAKGFKEGTDNLYQYSKAIDGQFAKSMDMISTALLYFRNSVAAAAAPIINQLAPAIDLLVDRVVEGLNWFNELSAKLTGASTWTKALKYPKEYAEATNKASKALKDFQMGFDELNVISDSGSSSAESAIDYSKMFTEMEVDIDFEPWADAFRKAIEDSDFYGAGVILGNKIKEVFAGLDTYEGGKTLADKLNNAIAFADGLLSTHPLDEIGTKIAEFLNGSLLNLNWFGLAETFSNGLNSILTGIDSFLVTLDAYNIGKKIGEGLSGFDLEETLSNAGNVIKHGLDDILDAVNGFLEGVEWDKLGGDLFKGLSDFIFGNDWGETGGKAIEVIKNLGSAIRDFMAGFAGEIVLNLFDDEWIDNWTVGAETITSDLDKLKSSFTDFGDVVKDKGGFWKFFVGFGEHIYDETHPAQDAAAESREEWAKSQNKFAEVVDVTKGTFTEFKDNWSVTVNDVNNKTANLKNDISQKFSGIKQSVVDNVGGMSLSVINKMQSLNASVSEKISIMKGSWTVGMNDIKTTASTKMGELFTLFSEWDGLDKFKEYWNSGKDAIITSVTEMKDSIGDIFGKIPEKIRGAANDIWYSVEQVINGMIEGFNHFADQISSKFSFTIPNIPGVAGAGQSFGLTIPHIPNLALGRFENGGYPDSASLFYANENGIPEMVGRIGNRTAVANNDQIVEAVADGVAAVLEVYVPQLIQAIRDGNDTAIQIDGKTITKVVNKHNRESGVSIFGGSVVNAT